MKKPFLCSPVILLGLSLAGATLAFGCGTTSPALPGVGPEAPLRYSTYGDPPRHLRNDAWALALMKHASHREQVFRQARAGLYPAMEVWLHLESVCRGAGGRTADEHAGRKCALLPSELGCELNWNAVRSLMPGEGPGQTRLLEVFKEGYDGRWAQVRKLHRVRTETARAGMLVAGAALGRGPAAAEGRAATAEGRAAAAESKALGAQARAVTAEAGARGRGLVSAETLGLSRALGAEEATALEARLLEMEAKSLGKREAFNKAELRGGQLEARARPAGVPEQSALWAEFEAYRQQRFAEVRAQWRGGKGSLTAKPPLRWDAYQELREHFQRSIEFETKVGSVLLKEMEQAVAARRLLGDSQQPLLARRLGVKKPGQSEVRYPDYFAVDEATLRAGGAPRVDSFSVKKRDFSTQGKQEVESQVKADTKEALGHYGGHLEVRRPGHPLFGQTVQVSNVHLVYDVRGVGVWQKVIQQICDRAGVEVHFE